MCYIPHYSLTAGSQFIRILVILARCPTSEYQPFQQDVQKNIRIFQDFIKWISCHSQVRRPSKLSFFGKLAMEQYFKSLENKSNSFLHFLQYDRKELRVLTNLILLVFGLADDQKSFNVTCNNAFLQSLWISLLF